jgi:hypothetical protein
MITHLGSSIVVVNARCSRQKGGLIRFAKARWCARGPAEIDTKLVRDVIDGGINALASARRAEPRVAIALQVASIYDNVDAECVLKEIVSVGHIAPLVSPCDCIDEGISQLWGGCTAMEFGMTPITVKGLSCDGGSSVEHANCKTLTDGGVDRELIVEEQQRDAIDVVLCVLQVFDEIATMAVKNPRNSTLRYSSS